MRNLVGPAGCDVTQTGNSLTQLFDAVVNDPRQMGLKGPQVDPVLGPQGQMLDPSVPFMDALWNQASPPTMGAPMDQQFREHMQRIQPAPRPDFYDLS